MMNSADHVGSKTAQTIAEPGDGGPETDGRKGPSWLVLSLGIAVVYFVAGYVGQGLALPPGNVTLLWPPSGIALAVALRYGWRSVPGIWLGAIASNLESFVGGGLSSTMIAVVGVIIGIGSFVQPMVGRWAVERWIGSRSLILEGGAFARFIVIAPIMCLVGSTVGTASLVAAGVISADQGSGTWLTWWLGDLIGVLLFTPLTQAVFGRRRRKLIWIALILVVGFGGAFYSGELIRRQATATWEETVRSEAETHSQTLVSWLERTSESIASMAALFIGSEDVTEDEFLSAIDVLEQTQPDFFPDSLAFVVGTSDKTSARANHWTIRHSTEFDGPLSAGPAFRGADASPMKTAVEDATAHPGKVRLAAFRTDDDGETVVYLSTSVGDEDAPAALVGTITLDSLIEGLDALLLGKGMAVRLSGRAAGEERTSRLRPLFGGRDPAADAVMSVTQRMPIAGAELSMHWDADAAFDGGPSFELGNAIFLGGMIGTSMLALFVMFLVLQNEQISLRVEQRTEEVQANARRAEQTAAVLSEKENQLKSALDSMSDGFFMVDRDGRIVLFNERLRDLLEVPPGLLETGSTFLEAARFMARTGAWGGGDPEDLAGKGVATLSSGEARTLETRTESGRLLETRIVPMVDGGSVGIVTDVSERKQSEKKLLEHMQELEQFNRLAVGRELRMIEIKAEINDLLRGLGKPSRYDILE